MAARMQRDWDARARVNAAYFVDFGAWRTEEEIRFAGERDAGLLVRGIPSDELATSEVLEIGCGIGRILLPLAERVRCAAGIDVSLEMLRIARERLEGTANVLLAHNDGTGTLSFRDSSFDLVFSCFVFEHVPWTVTARYLDEAGRVLRQGGRLRIQFTTPPSGLDVEEIAEGIRSKMPEGVEELMHGPTFEGDAIAKEDMEGFLKERGFHIEEIKDLGANNAGISAIKIFQG